MLDVICQNENDRQEECEMKFAMLYSCGKDCTLALDRMMEQGYEPACLICVTNTAIKRSYMHCQSYDVLKAYGKAL